MEYTLREEQERTAVKLCEFFDAATRGSRFGVTAPTGSGKSLVEIEVKKRRGPGCWLVTPRLEIAKGILRKEGAVISSMADLVRESWAHHVVTPIRFRNALVRGDVREEVREIIFDEGHHVEAASWDELQLLCGMPPAALLTATYFRGTARGTAKFLEHWGQAYVMISLPEAAAKGRISIPRCSIMPLVDDDVVELNSSGEFDVTSVASAYASRIDDLAQQCRDKFTDGTLWHRPTAFVFPNVEVANLAARALHRLGVAATVVTAKTKDAERETSYKMLLDRVAALCQVAVLGEGVDLPIRVLIDASPCMSPVKWLQQFGRDTRPVGPGEELPIYVCTNRNLSRHCYLLQGLVPPSVVAESDAAFLGTSRRGGYRALGLENIGRFKATEVKCLDGCTSLLYNLVSVNDGRSREFACIVHPASHVPVWAERVHGVKADGTRDWGRWQRCQPPSDLVGFASAPPRELTDKMRAWWDRSAHTRGLDPKQPMDRKKFAIFPLLFDIGLKFRCDPALPGRE